MKVLVTGVKGQLGYDVVNELTKRGHEAVGVDILVIKQKEPDYIKNIVSHFWII